MQYLFKSFIDNTPEYRITFFFQTLIKFMSRKISIFQTFLHGRFVLFTESVKITMCNYYSLIEKLLYFNKSFPVLVQLLHWISMKNRRIENVSSRCWNYAIEQKIEYSETVLRHRVRQSQFVPSTWMIDGHGRLQLYRDACPSFSVPTFESLKLSERTALV